MAKKIKIIIVLGMLSLGPLPAQAASSFTQGFYIGLAGGVGTEKTNFDVKFPDPTITDAENQLDLGGPGALGDLRLGWETPFWKQGYFALEATAGLSSIKGEAKLDTSDSGLSVDRMSVQERYSFSGLAKLGFIIDNALAYVKLGARYSNWELDTRFSVTGSTSSRNRQGHWGFDPGVGLAVRLTENLSLNGEFNYTFFQSKTFKDEEAIIYSYRPSTARFLIGLTYHFPWKRQRTL